MATNGTLFAFVVLFFAHGAAESQYTPKNLSKLQVAYHSKCGDPVFLTQYIESGQLDKARSLSRTGNFPNTPPLESYSGLITVNKNYDSNIFFWFFPAMNKNKKAPILLWLQGGPGLSGLFGLFVENGPYSINANKTASLRRFSWTRNYAVIYVDNPVGTGFSFTKYINGYVTNETQMANNMYEFLDQFFTLFSEYQDNEFYITGESYAGKYVPALSYKIHTMGSSTKMNLKGMAIGNGMCDPETMMDYSDYFYQLGLIDDYQAAVMRNLSETIVKDIQNGNYFDALIGMNKLIIKNTFLPYPASYFKNFTGLNFYYNYLMSEAPEDFAYYLDYIEQREVRQALNVGNLTYNSGEESAKHLALDIMQSIKPLMGILMENYRVMFYNGQLDCIIPYPLTKNFLKTVKWKYADEYLNAKRHIWTVAGNSNNPAGYVHQIKDFYEVLVRNAGHILPYDQPVVAFDLITRFINNEPFF